MSNILYNVCLFYIRLVCTVTPEGVGSFEGVLFPIFQIILQQDILGMIGQFFFQLYTLTLVL